MSSQIILGRQDLERDLWNKLSAKPHEMGINVCKFLDLSTTGFGRATYYNTLEEQLKAEQQAHEWLRTTCRDLYGTLLLLPGTTHRARQIGLRSLLSSKRHNEDNVFLEPIHEGRILEFFVKDLPPQRMLKIFDALRGGSDAFGGKSVNNARTRKLVLRKLLNSPKLELWSVKYRQRLKRVLVHVWGERVSSAIGGALMSRTPIIRQTPRVMEKHVDVYLSDKSEDRKKYVYQCLGFLFRSMNRFTSDMRIMNAFYMARKDLRAGIVLPLEVWEGIRSTYHHHIKPSQLVDWKVEADKVTTHERKSLQRRTRQMSTKLHMNPLKYDSVELYIYAYEMGADESIMKALTKKAQDAADMLPFWYEKVGVLIDASLSMAGSGEQRMRPIAAAMAMRDTLVRRAEKNVVAYCGGDMSRGHNFILPEGGTGLALPLLALMGEDPDAIFIISDGYENMPAGQVGDVIRLARAIGIDIPVFHLNPVFAAEAGSVRTFGEAIPGVITMPVRSPSVMGTTMMRGIIETDPKHGIEGLIKHALNSSSSPLRGFLQS